MLFDFRKEDEKKSNYTYDLIKTNIFDEYLKKYLCK